ncbi:dTDP-3-amino-3,6-dideoxy-alpha-D-glucopyranose N,N-dimethyltransferase [Gemmata obscuriglobus]|nr:dTDP-3-amino-3,6-dideoxy-alpha-D-glucopyranose N,N-dimethyltransferase [Gemmata obscuriglobus]VTS04657.1 Methyltransferase family protein OS=Ruminococcus sp. CAG:382 GN=BN636_01272 PE=4 SV=1: Methyltransf_18 [Gemmata obscuriglobus UQM 2246]
MLGYLRRAWTTWHAKSDFIASIRRNPSHTLFYAAELQFPELQEVWETGGPELQPYEGLASAWDEYGSCNQPDYLGLIKFLSDRHSIELRSVLDLACGTGLLTARLVRSFNEVVGLDASPRMLEVARARLDGCKGASFVFGDFRTFSLGRQFDVIVCTFNSLNYLGDLNELSGTFAVVAKHLTPGGIFVFDVTTERSMRERSGLYAHVTTNAFRFALYSNYDRKQRKQISRAITPTGIELHRRIPISLQDVKTAARESGLRVEECFSPSLIPVRWLEGYASFFVLTKAPD